MEKLGEYRVGITFNPSLDLNVDFFKKQTAALINALDSLKEDDFPEKNRLIALAQTTYEDAAMWAVKACTKQKPNTDGN